MRSKACWKIYLTLMREGELRFTDLGTRSGCLSSDSNPDSPNNNQNFGYLLLKLQTAQLIEKSGPVTYSIRKNIQDPTEFDALLKDANCRLKSLYEQDLVPVSIVKLPFNSYCKKCKRPLQRIVYRFWNYRYCRSCWEEVVKRAMKKTLNKDTRKELKEAIAKANLGLLPSREL